ncbi:hypothetical protein A3J78_00415 [Candidatus Beckwithbacteria bacterium RBG_13_35_6]|uniref:Uncharacterized protein n=1 Tax=Candidatus Beckwithbacteria bacterium RBG_13_35_6 TaxID=1797456 RepID=A0A1F5DD44_9BACT|nr:MAG: hypothetical protein A3J78_00415 [Candidatus Beckwithbacteria bacterium RBG_13_35_6]
MQFTLSFSVLNKNVTSVFITGDVSGLLDTKIYLTQVTIPENTIILVTMVPFYSPDGHVDVEASQ